jgi:hypothetical protein
LESFIGVSGAATQARAWLRKYLHTSGYDRTGVREHACQERPRHELLRKGVLKTLSEAGDFRLLCVDKNQQPHCQHPKGNERYS